VVTVFPDIDALVETAARQVVRAASEAVERSGRFLLTLSGGHSPGPLYRLLASDPYSEMIPWEQTFVLWSDERYVPLEDERSNAGNARELLLRHVPVPESQIMTMYQPDLHPEQAAKAYEKSLRALSGADELHLDLTFLGCGEDGHTASLFPGSSVLKGTDDRLVVYDLTHDVPRISMTPHLINLSRTVVFLVYGHEKAAAVQKVLTGPHDPELLPAQSISPLKGETHWFLDTPSAALLKKDITSPPR
jgi:6-phosphogluconolactonase